MECCYFLRGKINVFKFYINIILLHSYIYLNKICQECVLKLYASSVLFSIYHPKIVSKEQRLSSRSMEEIYCFSDLVYYSFSSRSYKSSLSTFFNLSVIMGNI